MNAIIHEKLKLLPDQPGCYLMKNADETIIYVGKAKVLKNRVKSYFTGTHEGKTERLVQEIADFDYIITSSEIEALILEMNLIKEIHPKYNSMLMDDKSYPYIKITNERHPRLIITRKVIDDQGKYFGPYPNVTAAKEVKKLLDLFYPLRNCPIHTNRACLHYHLGQCIGPCARKVNVEEYKQTIDQIIHFFHGGYTKMVKQITKEMTEASRNLDYEKAEKLNKKIDYIKTVMEKQKAISFKKEDSDVWGFAHHKGCICIQTFFIRKGKLIDRHSAIIPIISTPEREFHAYVSNYYSLIEQMPTNKDIWLPPTLPIENISGKKIVQPKRGKKREFVRLVCQNAKASLHEYFSLQKTEEGDCR